MSVIWLNSCMLDFLLTLMLDTCRRAQQPCFLHYQLDAPVDVNSSHARFFSKLSMACAGYTTFTKFGTLGNCEACIRNYKIERNVRLAALQQVERDARHRATHVIRLASAHLPKSCSSQLPSSTCAAGMFVALRRTLVLFALLGCSPSSLCVTSIKNASWVKAGS